MGQTHADAAPKSKRSTKKNKNANNSEWCKKEGERDDEENIERAIRAKNF